MGTPETLLVEESQIDYKDSGIMFSMDFEERDPMVHNKDYSVVKTFKAAQVAFSLSQTKQNLMICKSDDQNNNLRILKPLSYLDLLMINMF